MTKFLLIRHATTDAVGKSLSGRMPGVHLNETGKMQAQELAAQLKYTNLTAIYSSPLERAMETAAPIATFHNLTCMFEESFMELDFGAWTDRSFEELAHDAQFRKFNSFRSGTRIPGGEMMQEGQSRMVRGLEELAFKHPGETVAIVSHSDMIKASIAFYAGIHLDMFQRIEISPASVSIVELYDDFARILLLNYTGDLYNVPQL